VRSFVEIILVYIGGAVDSMSMVMADRVSYGKLLVPFIIDISCGEHKMIDEYELRYLVLPEVDSVLRGHNMHFDLDGMDIMEMVYTMTQNNILETHEEGPTRYTITNKGRRFLERRKGELEEYLGKKVLDCIESRVRSTIRK
jgi:hypothetical protein